jgi:YbaB/EbfC DNA-binding family protein
MDWQRQSFQNADEAHEAALAALDAEERKLAELEKTMETETTTVRSKGRQLSMTFDGRGELTEITFHGAKYRTMAPAELAHTLVETLREGRAQSMAKLNSHLGSSLLPGVDFGQLASGKVGAKDIFDQLFSPILNEFVGDGVLGRAGKKESNE